MATHTRRQSPTLKEAILHEGFRFDFFQAIRILESFGDFEKNSHKKPVFRFHTRLALDFPASAIDFIYQEQSLYHLIVNFMGLTGPQGVLPRHYTEELISRAIIQKDHTTHDYLDIFSHQMILLFYQAWKKHQVWIDSEQNQKNKMAHYFLDLIGLGTKGLQKRLEVTEDGFFDENLIYYSGIISQKPRSISALTNILEDYFECPVYIAQCTGKWLHLEPYNQTILSSKEPSKLGKNCVLGSRVWDIKSTLHITIGALSYKKFQKFLPGSSYYEMTKSFIQFFLNNQFDFQIELKLKKDEIPKLSLESGNHNPVKLGWSTWIGLPKKDESSLKSLNKAMKTMKEEKEQNPVFSSRMSYQ